MMPSNSRQPSSENGLEWDSLMEVEHEPIEKNYTLLEEIGKGQFAVVKKCVERSTGAVYAAKIIRKKRVARGVAAADIAREAGLLARLKHPNIVSLYKVIDTGATVVLLLELITGGELFHWLPSNEAEAAHVVRQVLKALCHLHSHQVAHLDIKPDNILLFTAPPMPSIKLIDLGLSQRLTPESEHRALFGTPEFVAPEIVNYEPLTLGTDLWAIGVLTYMLVSGASPFLGEDKQETYTKVAACKFEFDDKHFSYVSEYAKNFISSLLIRDPKKRGTAESCLAHPWIVTETQSARNLSESIVTAVKTGCVQTISHLLDQGAPIGARDMNGDTLLHIACRSGDESVVSLLINHGIDLNALNGAGLTPMHIIAQSGYIDLARLLAIAGCTVEKPNRAGIRADVTAIKYGHPDIASLLDKLRNSAQREIFSRQLQTNNKTIDCMHVRLLGHCASGKTALVNSLKSGIFNFGFFKRSKSLSRISKRDMNIELDFTSKHNSFSFDLSNSRYEDTVGIELTRTNLGGDCIFWEFCGKEEFMVFYHQALMTHQPIQVHLITINLRQPFTVQLQQARFWIRFILDRVPLDNMGFAGKCEKIKIIIVGTYSPEPIVQNSNGLHLLSPILNSLREFVPLLGEELQAVAVDATNPSCPGVKLLRSYLVNARSKLVEDNRELKWSGLIDSWRNHVQSLEDAPTVLNLKEFVAEVRKVNPMTSLEHCKQLGQHLQILGDCEILPGDLYVLNLEWLWQDLMSWQLSSLNRNEIYGGRKTGVYSLDDFQARCSFPADEALQILQAFHLCIACEIEEDVEYEIPCLNLIERLPGLWDPWVSPSLVPLPHAGFKICPTEARLYHLSPIFPHLQVQLRKITRSWDRNDSDLYQWHRGSKLCLGPCECLITFEEEEQGYIQVWVRGPHNTGPQCFSLLDIVFEAINVTTDIVASGLLLERHWQSPSQLRDYDEIVHSWDPVVINSALLDRTFDDAYFKNPFNGKHERVLDMIGCGMNSLDNCTPGIKQSIKFIRPMVRRRLAQLLDPPDKFGRDWCLLSVRLGVGDKISHFDSKQDSPTLRMLKYAETNCTVAFLIKQLRALDREDAVRLLLTFTSTYIVSVITNESDSGSNLSR